MNHFTPFFPAAALIRPPKLSDEKAKDLETRLLHAVRMRQRAQRIAEAALLVSIGFTIALTFAFRM